MKQDLDNHSILLVQIFLILAFMMNTKFVSISCPECEHSIELNADLIVGQQATCQSCHTELVVTWLFPICLDYQETKEPVSMRQDLGLD